jgi:hypothetical protein
VQRPKLYEIYSPKNKQKNWPKKQMKNQIRVAIFEQYKTKRTLDLEASAAAQGFNSASIRVLLL